MNKIRLLILSSFVVLLSLLCIAPASAQTPYEDANDWGDDGESLGGYNFDYQTLNVEGPKMAYYRFLTIDQRAKTN